MDDLDPAACYRALQARDARFDGCFFVGVMTTGIYCRPICPARTPKVESCRFFPTAAAAQEAGLRPCLRCRPEASPQAACWRGTSNTVARALALLDAGALEASEVSLEDLAGRLGVGERQLRRLFHEHLGASPIAVAQNRRIHFAKQLIHETQLTMTEVALASGFGSVRRFNETFRTFYGRPPSELRRSTRLGGSPPGPSSVALSMAYRPPYDWDAMWAHLAARAIPGVERVLGASYLRTVEHQGQSGTVEVTRAPKQHALRVVVRFPNVRALPQLVQRVRRVFDLDSDVARIGRHLARDPALAALVARRPGLRAPGGWDGFELAVRAVLGQQISVARAGQLLGRLVERFGESLDPQAAGDSGLTRLFPTPARLVGLDLESGLGLPRARLGALRGLARAAQANPRLFEASQSLDQAIARFRAIPGIGDWTAQVIALRALREPDAFPASDVGLLRAMGSGGSRPSPVTLQRRAEAWRPWRAYAAQHLWAQDAHAAPRRGDP